MRDGVFVANLTPMQSDGSIDVAAYVAHASWLAGCGVSGLVPFGTNGEGPLVGLRERLPVLDALFDTHLATQIVPAVSAGNAADAQEAISAYNDFPADAIMILPPYYYKPVDADGLRRYFEPLIARSRHPVILYHTPKYAVPIPPEVVTSLPVWGVKDSGSDEAYAKAILPSGKGVLIGTEDDVWHRLSLGANGLISALANFIPEMILDVRALYDAGAEEAGTALSRKLQDIRAAAKPFGIAGLKRLAQQRTGIPMGTVRAPLVPLAESVDLRAVEDAVRGTPVG